MSFTQVLLSTIHDFGLICFFSLLFGLGFSLLFGWIANRF